jgi:putative ABC transport system substrate-binding protein
MTSRRRALSAIAALAIPGRVGAQARSDAPVKVVGYLSRGAGKEAISSVLAERGYVEGRNLRIVFRAHTKDEDELEAMARELVQARPDVLVAWGGANINALARQTRTIPIVCAGTADPVGMGYAKTLRRPGGNITGLSYGLPEMAEVIVGLMQVVRTGLRRIVVYVAGDPGSVGGWGPVLRSIEAAARQSGLSWEVAAIGSLADFQRSIATMDAATSMAYIVRLPDSMSAADAAAALVRRRMASATNSVHYVRDGVLMHYSIDHADERRRVAAIIDTLLRGANAAELPFELPDRTTFVVNRRTARAIGLELAPAVLARATEIVD